MDLVDVVFLLVVLFCGFRAGYLDLRVFQDLFFWIAAVPLYGNRVYKVGLVWRGIECFLRFADQDIVCRPGAKRRVFLDVHKLLARKRIKAELGKCIGAAVKVAAVVVDDMRAVSDRGQVRSNAFTVCFF